MEFIKGTWYMTSWQLSTTTQPIIRSPTFSSVGKCTINQGTNKIPPVAVYIIPVDVKVNYALGIGLLIQNWQHNQPQFTSILNWICQVHSVIRLENALNMLSFGYERLQWSRTDQQFPETEAFFQSEEKQWCISKAQFAREEQNHAKSEVFLVTLKPITIPLLSKNSIREREKHS